MEHLHGAFYLYVYMSYLYIYMVHTKVTETQNEGRSGNNICMFEFVEPLVREVEWLRRRGSIGTSWLLS